MLYRLIYLLAMLIPAVGLLSGFSVAATIPMFLILILITLRDNLLINLKLTTFLDELLARWKLECIFAIWCFITIFYSPNHLNSIIVYSQVLLILLIGFIVNNNIAHLSIKIPTLQRNFLIGMAFAISIFFIEYSSQGFITLHFRAIFQSKTSREFFLFLLDKGCSLLSVFSWIVIGILLQYHKYLVALIYYLLIIYLLSISDSLASFVAFIIGGLVFLSSRLLITKSLQSIFLKLFTTAMLLGSILMPIIFYKMEPYSMASEYANFLPPSAKHRLFVWNFVAKKISEKPILGHGLAASRPYQVKNDELVIYQQKILSPFPLHPHNNIMQILFETGLIGCLLFLLLIRKYIQQIGNLALLGKIKDNMINYQVLNYLAVSYAAFINYYIIGMISFSIWQTWWVCTAFGTVTFMLLLVRKTHDKV